VRSLGMLGEREWEKGRDREREKEGAIYKELREK
jgi:hypothetical protein